MVSDSVVKNGHFGLVVALVLCTSLFVLGESALAQTGAGGASGSTSIIQGRSAAEEVVDTYCTFDGIIGGVPYNRYRFGDTYKVISFRNTYNFVGVERVGKPEFKSSKLDGSSTFKINGNGAIGWVTTWKCIYSVR